MARRGLLLVLSSPSGAGKTTLSRRLLAAEPELQLSISVTTRAPRPGDVEGRDYYFRDAPEFERMIAAGEFLEWARVHANLYGTPRKPVEEALGRGRDVLFDIDWQGARQIGASVAGDLVRVFILPPSAGELIRRLESRNTDSAEVIHRRLSEAVHEIGHWSEYDYVLVNADLDATVARLREILAAERQRRSRQVGLETLVNDLQAGLRQRLGS